GRIVKMYKDKKDLSPEVNKMQREWLSGFEIENDTWFFWLRIRIECVILDVLDFFIIHFDKMSWKFFGEPGISTYRNKGAKPLNKKFRIWSFFTRITENISTKSSKFKFFKTEVRLKNGFLLNSICNGLKIEPGEGERVVAELRKTHLKIPRPIYPLVHPVEMGKLYPLVGVKKQKDWVVPQKHKSATIMDTRSHE
ncbi:unnamed protein product, partial [marine sediment metagenome]